MSKLSQACPYCGKPLKLKSSLNLGSETLNTYECGHALAGSFEHKHSDIDFSSLNGSMLAYDYQKEGIEFIVNETSYNALIADQMGLGKTIQALLAHRANYKEKSPAIYIVKSSTTWQWQDQYRNWCDKLPLGVFLIQNTTSWIPPGFNSYILSMDMLSSLGNCQCGHSHRSHPEKDDRTRCKVKGCKCFSFVPVETMIDKLLALKPKLVVVDEVHSFKNTDSSRSQALMKLFKEVNKVKTIKVIPITCFNCSHKWDEQVTTESDSFQLSDNVEVKAFCPECNAHCYGRNMEEKITIPKRECDVIMLSGTPIVNRASEYFVPLNILDPARFYSKARFTAEWIDDDGKRIKPYKLAEFRELISHYVLRRERNEVLKDLPSFRRTFTMIQMESEELKALYNKEIEKLVLKASESGRDLNMRDIQENLSSMRRITALAKVDYVADMVDQFMDETEDEKIAIGLHHIDVRHALKYALQKHNPLTLSGEDSAHDKFRIVQEFKKPGRRLILMNMLAGGTGIDGLQVCNNVDVIERQWSSAYEDQFEDRFNRPGQERPVTCNYTMIKSACDQFFHDLVEEKRGIIGETVENNYDPTNMSASAMQFIDWSVANKV